MSERYPSDPVLRALSEQIPTDKASIIEVLWALGRFIDQCAKAEIWGFDIEADYYHLQAEFFRLKAYACQHSAPPAQWIGDCQHRAHMRAMRILTWILARPYHAIRFRAAQHDPEEDESETEPARTDAQAGP